jgi:hypothetical protein
VRYMKRVCFDGGAKPALKPDILSWRYALFQGVDGVKLTPLPSAAQRSKTGPNGSTARTNSKAKHSYLSSTNNYQQLYYYIH